MEEGVNNSLSDYIEELLESALVVGITEWDFWDMTLGEITRRIEARNKQIEFERSERAYFDYTHAMLIGSIVSDVLSGKSHTPSYEKAYEGILGKKEIEEDDTDELKADASTVRFLQFANAYNSKYEVKE